MGNQGYNGKTHLLVTYQWNNGANDAIIIDKDFDTTNEAFRQMALIMPATAMPDDGYPIKEWAYLIEKGCDDIFKQYNVQLDRTTNILAVLRPIRNQQTFENQSIMEKDNNIKPVSIRYNEDGQPDGVRIRTLDEDFTIALHDACDHNLDAYEARALGQAMTLKQAHILCAYLDEVQQTLEDAGGDLLDGWYVTCADSYAIDTWYFSSTYGCVISPTCRCSGSFRSRPVLA